MTSSKHVALAAMEGHGFYNRNSSVQAAGIRRMLPLWAQIAGAVEVGAELAVIVDYGSSQGRNSMAPMRVAVEAVRAGAGPDKPVQVIHTDLPSNDFASLFRALDEDPDSYLAGHAGVFAAAVGRSYFEPILPPGQVHLGWNSWTLHWLSRNPGYVPDHLLARLSAIPAVRAAAGAQAADDWRRFLTARACELRPGGKVLSLIVVAGEGASSDWLWTQLWAAVVELGRAGLLSPDEQLRITMPTHQRTVAEIEAPFAGDGRFAGLRLEHVELAQVPDPFWEVYRNTGEAGAFGRSWADMGRAVFGPSILAAIGRDRGSLIDRLFAEFAARIGAAPQPTRFHLAAVVLAQTV